MSPCAIVERATVADETQLLGMSRGVVPIVSIGAGSRRKKSFALVVPNGLDRAVRGLCQLANTHMAPEQNRLDPVVTAWC